MLRALALCRTDRTFEEVPPGAIGKIRGLGDRVLWVDLSEPTTDELALLAREFGFHPLSVEDCTNRHQRPKIDEYAGYYFLVVYEAGWSGERLEVAELAIFLGKDYLVTVHTDPIRALATAERLWRNWTDLAERGAGLLAYLVVDAVVDDYMPLLDTVSDRLEDVEEAVFSGSAASDGRAVEKVFRLKKDLMFLRRVVTPLRDVFNTLLRREQAVVSRETIVYFQDVFDHLIRVADTIDVLRDMLSSVMDAYLSVSNTRMNVVMKRLTSMATILMSVTLIASVFGMNFHHMPELALRYGYVGVLSAMLVLGVALYVYFRRHGWL